MRLMVHVCSRLWDALVVSLLLLAVVAFRPALVLGPIFLALGFGEWWLLLYLTYPIAYFVWDFYANVEKVPFLRELGV